MILCRIHKCTLESLKFYTIIDAAHTTATGGYDIDPERRYHLSGEFAMLLSTLGNLLQQCTNVDSLKNFLRFFCHPLYPEKLYIDPNVYCDAKTASDVLLSLTPMYINFIHHYLLQEIVDKLGNDECKHHYQRYKQTFQRLVRKLRHHPAPVTDDNIEQCSSQKRLQVSVDGDVNRTTPQDMQTVQGAITQATGICQAGLVYANQDPGNSVIFNFLIPHSFVELFNELCDNDLTTLACAGITNIQVEELEIAVIKTHTTELKRVKGLSSSTARASREPVKPSSLEHHLKERQDIPSQERCDLIAMVKMISDTQLNEVCSEELLLEFSSCIHDWRTLAPFLGMQDFYYDEFTTRYPTVADQSYQLLLYWKRRMGKSAIYHHLLETVVLHGKTEEVRALTQIPLRGRLYVCVWVYEIYQSFNSAISSDNLEEQLRRRYSKHAKMSENNRMQVDARLVQLKTNSSDYLKELDYSTRLDTVEEFGDDVENISPKEVMNIIAAAKPGTCISITGPRGIGKTTFITRMCNFWALGCNLWQYKLLFWIDLSTTRDKSPNDVSHLLRSALSSMNSFTKTDLRSVVTSVLQTKGKNVLIVLDHFSQQDNQLLSELLNLELITVVVSSSHAIKGTSFNVHVQMLGLTDRQISKLVLHYYCNDHSRAEHFLQYLSSVPNFSNLKRVPVYLVGLLSVFHTTSTAHPPRTLMTFLSCLAFTMLNLPEDKQKQMTEHIAHDSIPGVFIKLASPTWSLLRIICWMLFPRSKSIFHKTELVLWPSLPPSLLRPVQVALPLRPGEWLQLTQYPLLNDFLASLHLHNQNFSVMDTVKHLTAHKELQYFCLKTMSHIHEEFKKQKNDSYVLALTLYGYEDADTLEVSTAKAEIHNNTVTASTMWSLTSAAQEVVFTDCHFSPPAALILSNIIGSAICVKYHRSEIMCARYVG